LVVSTALVLVEPFSHFVEALDPAFLVGLWTDSVQALLVVEEFPIRHVGLLVVHTLSRFTETAIHRLHLSHRWLLDFFLGVVGVFLELQKV